jgi:hypothetical protein
MTDFFREDSGGPLGVGPTNQLAWSQSQFRLAENPLDGLFALRAAGSFYGMRPREKSPYFRQTALLREFALEIRLIPD